MNRLKEILEQHKIYSETGGSHGAVADLSDADLSDADLSHANLRDADLSHANLRDADLEGSTWGCSKEEEQKTARQLLQDYEQENWVIRMESWHGENWEEHDCGTVHCLAGQIEPSLKDPSLAAARKAPTLSLYFYRTKLNPDSVIALVKAVASGSHSVFNKGPWEYFNFG